jgi:parvulin-like peptidyl-prolyl isomerase
MRLMEMIRRKGRLGLMIFLGVMAISVFAGLGVGFFSFGQNRDLGPRQSESSGEPQLVKGGEMAGVAMRVDGRDVSNKDFDAMVALAKERAGSLSDDPGMFLQLYGYIAGALVNEEVMLKKGEELNVTVSAADIAKAKDDAVAQYMAKTAPKTGNVLADLAGKLTTAREKSRAFSEFLERSGLSEEDWLAQTRRSLLLENMRKRMQELADEKKRREAEDKKKQIDGRLAKGESFAKLAMEFSDDPTAPKGGDIGTWVGRPMIYEANADTVFSTPTGKITPWLDIPAGFQRFEIYDKKEASGPDFEAAKPKLTEQVISEKGKDYKPTEEDLKKAYGQIKFRQILLRATDDKSVDEELGKLTKDAVVEINYMYPLAHQALYETKLRPPAGTTYDALVKIAKNSAVGPGYNFTVIKTKLPETKEPAKPAEGAAGADAKAGAGADAPSSGKAGASNGAGASGGAASDAPSRGKAEGDAGAAQGGAAGGGEGAKPGELPREIDVPRPPESEPIPLYALAIGLLREALNERGSEAGYMPYFLIAKVYMDWLDDAQQLPRQEIDRDKARQEIEDAMAQVVKRNEYSGLAHALRGLNLAWLKRNDEAAKELALAQKYAPQKSGDTWMDIRKGYEKLGDAAKLVEVDKIIGSIQAKERQEMLQRMLQQQQGGGMPPSLPQGAGQ